MFTISFVLIDKFLKPYSHLKLWKKCGIQRKELLCVTDTFNIFSFVAVTFQLYFYLLIILAQNNYVLDHLLHILNILCVIINYALSLSFPIKCCWELRCLHPLFLPHYFQLKMYDISFMIISIFELLLLLDVASHLHELAFFKVSRKQQRQKTNQQVSKFIAKHQINFNTK